MNGFNEIYIRDMTFILNIKGLFASLKGKGEKRLGDEKKIERKNSCTIFKREQILWRIV